VPKRQKGLRVTGSTNVLNPRPGFAARAMPSEGGQGGSYADPHKNP